jgi:replicative DNA helicase
MDDAAPAPAATPDQPRSKRAAKAPPRETVSLRELPFNVDLERAILAVLLDGRHVMAMSNVRQVVEHPLAFYQRDHRIIYLACLELDDAGQRVDAQSVAELLSRYDFKAVMERLRQQQLLFDSDQLDGLGRDRLRAFYHRTAEDETKVYEDSALAAIGGFNSVSDLTLAFAPAASIQRNVTLLWDYYCKRRFILSITALADKAYRTPDTFQKLVDEGGQAMLALGRQNKSTSIHDITSVVNETIEDLANQQENPETGVKTGIDDLDRSLMSLRPGGLYILAARPGVGKTSLALKIVANIAGHPDHANGVLFFSLEVDRKDLVKKLLCAEAGVDFKSLEPGTVMEPHEMDRVLETGKRFKSWDLALMDVSDLTVHALRSVVKRRMLETNGGLKLVVIDYLQLLSSAKPDATEYEKVSEISRVLKVLARELRIPVMALSQMSRDSEKGAGTGSREPRLSDLRGSGSIEQDADAVLFIHRVDQDEGPKEDPCRRIKVIVAKNRFGPIGFATMHFFPAKMRFEQAAFEDALGDDDDDDGSNAPAQREYQKTRKERSERAPSDEEDLFK